MPEGFENMLQVLEAICTSEVSLTTRKGSFLGSLILLDARQAHLAAVERSKICNCNMAWGCSRALCFRIQVSLTLVKNWSPGLLTPPSGFLHNPVKLCPLRLRPDTAPMKGFMAFTFALLPIWAGSCNARNLQQSFASAVSISGGSGPFGNCGSTQTIGNAAVSL